MPTPPEALAEAVRNCRWKWNSVGSIARRLWVPKTHLNSPPRLRIYPRYNRLYARQTKQDMRFGRRLRGQV